MFWSVMQKHDFALGGERAEQICTKKYILILVVYGPFLVRRTTVYSVLVTKIV